MIKTKIMILMSVVSVILSGCAGRIVHMEDNQGAHITCEVSMASAMMTGILIRDSSIDDCVRQKEGAGFKVVDEI